VQDWIREISLFVNIGVPILVLMGAYFIGNHIEKRHYRSIREREDAAHDYPVVSFKTMPGAWTAERSQLVSGSVVISLDYFKRIIAGLRGLIGGRIKTYEPLLDRARREALLRMIDDARSNGFDAVFNVRLETSRLANARRNGKGVAGIEMLAFGTAVKFAGRADRPE